MDTELVHLFLPAFSSILDHFRDYPPSSTAPDHTISFLFPALRFLGSISTRYPSVIMLGCHLMVSRPFRPADKPLDYLSIGYPAVFPSPRPQMTTLHSFKNGRHHYQSLLHRGSAALPWDGLGNRDDTNSMAVSCRGRQSRFPTSVHQDQERTSGNTRRLVVNP